MAREYPLRAVVGRVVDGGESREWRAGMVNKWSREDLPDPYEASLIATNSAGKQIWKRMQSPGELIDSVVEHLNEHHPKPYDRGGLRGSTWVERERDSALSRAETAEFRWAQMRDRAEAAERERDEAVARAEAAEARLADPYSQANQDAAAWDRVAAHPALRMDLLPDVEGSYADRVFERITWLAEVAEAVTEMKPAVAAEARTTPAVPLHQPDGTRMDASHLPIGADYEQRLAPTGRAGVYDAEMEAEVRRRTECLRENLRGVEAARDKWEGKYWAAVSGKDESPDPIEAKARKLWNASNVTWTDWSEVEGDTRRQFLKLAAHVLGQEDRHVDQ